MSKATAEIAREAYSPREIAVKYGVSERHIRNLIYSGRLGHLRMGQRLVVPIADLDRYLASVRVGP